MMDTERKWWVGNSDTDPLDEYCAEQYDQDAEFVMSESIREYDEERKKDRTR
jgi:hypothetical protein